MTLLEEGKSNSRECHGDHGSRLYGIWQDMKKRCYDIANNEYYREVS